MGGKASKPDLPDTPEFDLSKATVSLPTVQEFEQQAQAAVNQATHAAQDLYAQNSWMYSIMRWSLILAILAGIGYACWVYVYPWARSIIRPVSSSSSSSSNPVSVLKINSAKLSTGEDITEKLFKLQSSTSLSVVVNEAIGANPGSSLNVEYEYQSGTPLTTTAAYGETLNIKPLSYGTSPTTTQGTSNGNQASSLKDATVSQTIPSSEAPQTEALYSYQFWMYIKDWNYMFGKDKYVFSRSSGGISNPLVMLHPTENTMKISVSVYPNEKTSKNEPAPAGHSGATDDVFNCEVPNIPLQRWVSVSISVSTKNLDVYVDGNLVKSCLLTGVPKPAMGDIIISPNGGYSGWICGFNHYSKVLIPNDAQLFKSFGPPCSLPGDSYTSSFGYFNSSGKEVSKYVF